MTSSCECGAQAQLEILQMDFDDATDSIDRLSARTTELKKALNECEGKAQRLTASREAERQKYGELVPAIQAAEAAATSLMDRVGELEALVLEERAKCASVERARDDANTRAADERNEASGALQAAIKRAERAEEQLEALSEQRDEIAVLREVQKNLTQQNGELIEKLKQAHAETAKIVAQEKEALQVQFQGQLDSAMEMVKRGELRGHEEKKKDSAGTNPHTHVPTHTSSPVPSEHTKPFSREDEHYLLERKMEKREEHTLEEECVSARHNERAELELRAASVAEKENSGGKRKSLEGHVGECVGEEDGDVAKEKESTGGIGGVKRMRTTTALDDEGEDQENCRMQ